MWSKVVESGVRWTMAAGNKSNLKKSDSPISDFRLASAASFAACGGGELVIRS